MTIIIISHYDECWREHLDCAVAEIERLTNTLQEWQRVGDAIMATIGKTGPLSDSDVIGEINRLRAERDDAREAAREMYTDVAQYDPCNQCPGWRKARPWLDQEEQER